MSNEDVHGLRPLSGLLVHDFWGQNITLADSHKSYRPFTVLTYRLNYAIHGIDPFGYHAGNAIKMTEYFVTCFLGNVIIYALACVVMYFFSQQWLPLHGKLTNAYNCRNIILTIQFSCSVIGHFILFSPDPCRSGDQHRREG